METGDNPAPGIRPNCWSLQGINR